MLFPEYFIIRVNEFDKEASTPLEEWLDYLKNGCIKDDTTTSGLAEARKKLQYMMMSKEETDRYFRYVDSLTYERSAMESSRVDGLYEGMKKGLEKGRAEGLAKGEAKGRAEGKAEGLTEGLAKGEAKGEAKAKLAMAKALLDHGVDIEIITKTTGLTADEVTR